MRTADRIVILENGGISACGTQYEQLRDDIFLLWSAQGWTENSSQTAKNWTDFRVKYQSNGTEMLRRKNTDV